MRELLGVYSEEGRDAGSIYPDKSVPSEAFAEPGNERVDAGWLPEMLLKSIESRSVSDSGFLKLGMGMA